MYISPNLYVSDSLLKKRTRIVRQILHNRKLLRLYIVTNASNSDNLLDIYDYKVFFQKAYRKYFEVTVYGIAKTKDEAIELVEQMTRDCYDVQKNADLLTFLNRTDG